MNLKDIFSYTGFGVNQAYLRPQVQDLEVSKHVSDEERNTAEEQTVNVTISAVGRRMQERSEKQINREDPEQTISKEDGRRNLKINFTAMEPKLEEAYTDRVITKIKGTGEFEQSYGGPGNLAHVNTVR